MTLSIKWKNLTRAKYEQLKEGLPNKVKEQIEKWYQSTISLNFNGLEEAREYFRIEAEIQERYYSLLIERLEIFNQFADLN